MTTAESAPMGSDAGVRPEVHWRGSVRAGEPVELVLEGTAAACGLLHSEFIYQYSVGEKVALGSAVLFSRCVREPQPSPEPHSTTVPQFKLIERSAQLRAQMGVQGVDSTKLHKGSSQNIARKTPFLALEPPQFTGSDSCGCDRPGGSQGLDRRGDRGPDQIEATPCTGCYTSSPWQGLLVQGTERQLIWVDQNNDPIFCTNWRQDPATPQRVVLTSLGDGTALARGFAAGQTCIKCTYSGLTLCTPTNVMSTYSLVGRFGFTNQNGTIIRPHDHRVDLLFRDDDFGDILIGGIYYSYYSTAYTDPGGNYNFSFIGSDDVALYWWSLGRDAYLFSTYPNYAYALAIDSGGFPIDGPYWVVNTDPTGTAGALPDVTAQDSSVPRNGNGPYSIINTLEDGWHYIDTNIEFAPGTISAEWQPTWTTQTQTFLASPNLIKVAGVNSATSYNDDSFDRNIILHELGHWVDFRYRNAPHLQCPPPPVGHNYWSTSNPQCALEEGWAHFFGGAASGAPAYHNLINWNLSSPIDHIDFDLELDTSDPTLPTPGPTAELSVGTSFWDVFDTTNDVSSRNNDANGTRPWTGPRFIWLVNKSDIGNEGEPAGPWFPVPITITEFLHGWKTNIANWAGDQRPPPGITYTPFDHGLFLNIFAAKSINGRGVYPTGIRDMSVPATFALQGVRPSPFNGTTSVYFSLPTQSSVKIDIFDLAGRRIRTLDGTALEAGYHTVPWDGRDEAGRSVGSGIYAVRMRSGSFEASAKVAVVK